MFMPRVPVSQNKSEIEMPARVCASETVEGCWDAIRCCHDLHSEMRKNNTSGYYFFIYEFDAANFQASNVFDAEKTKEVIAMKMVKGTLVSAFYVDKYRLNTEFKIAREDASIEEAVSAYNDWQKDDLYKIEDLIEKIEW